MTKLGEWVLINLRIGALSLAASGRSIIFREEVVAKRAWLTPEEFQEAYTIAQVLPGPNLINLSVFLGRRLLGARAAALGVLALALPGALLAVFITGAVDFTKPRLALLMNGFSVGSLTLFVALVVALAPGLRTGAGTRRKLYARIALGAAVAAASLAGAALDPVIGCGILAALAVEFAL